MKANIYDELKAAIRCLHDDSNPEAARNMVKRVYAASSVEEARAIIRLAVPWLYRVVPGRRPA